MAESLQKNKKERSYRFISVLDKWLVSDLLKTVLSVLSVIVIIIVSRKFIKVLVRAIEGGNSNETVITMLGLNIVIAINAFLPVSIFMSILMVLGRMYRDQEMPAIASAGGGARVIYRAVFLLVIPLAIVAAGMSMIATPWAEAKMRAMIHADSQSVNVRGITEGRFSKHSHGNLVFYTESIDSNQRMHNVFAQTKSDHSIGIITSKHGRMESQPDGLYLILEDGERTQGMIGQVDFMTENFIEYGIRIDERESTIFKLREGKSTQELWSSTDLLDIAEIQERLSIPLSVLFLSFLAVPLAKLSPRGGVYGSLIVAFAIYFIYGNLKRISHSWVVNQVIPASMGYFWVYVVLFLLGSGLLIRLYGLKWVLKQRGFG